MMRMSSNAFPRERRNPRCLLAMLPVRPGPIDRAWPRLGGTTVGMALVYGLDVLFVWITSYVFGVPGA